MAIYLDYQASTPVDPRVTAVMMSVMERSFANPSSESHSDGWTAKSIVETARADIALAVSCDPDEIVFTAGATEADNLGVLGAALGAPSKRRRILVGATEHRAVLEAARAAVQFGFSVEVIPVDRRGLVDISFLRALVDDSVAVVSVMAVNNEIGTIQALDEIISISRAVGAFIHTDATQAPCAMEIDVGEWGVDAASFSSHKIYGPKGVGALFLSAAAPWRPMPLLFGGGQEQGLRPGTLPTPLCAGFAEAFSIISAEGLHERERIKELRDEFAYQLSNSVSCFKRTSIPPDAHPGNLHATFAGVDADDLLARIQPQISASTGSACASGLIQGSHVLEAIGLTQSHAREGVRFSIGRFSQASELRLAASVIAAAVEEIQQGMRVGD